MKMNKNTLRYQFIKMMLLISMLTLFLVVSVLSFIIFNHSSKRIKEDVDFYIKSIQNQFSNNLRFLEESILYIRQNEEVNNFFTNNYDKEKIIYELEGKINLFSEWNVDEIDSPFVEDIYIINKNKDIINLSFYPKTIEDKNKSEAYILKNIEEYLLSNKEYMYKKNADKIDLYFTIYDKSLKAKSYMTVIINSKNIDKVFQSLEKYKYYFAISDSDNNILLGDDSILDMKSDKYFYYTSKHSFLLYSHILINKSALYEDIALIFRSAWIFAMSIFVISIFLIYYYSGKITKPLQSIVGKLKKFGDGDFSTKLEEHKLKEFHEISVSFNEMVNRLDKMIISLYKNELLVKDAKIKYLQAQIDPHFLFNVLSMISIRLKLNKDEETYGMVNSLAGLMQGKLFRKNEIEIPILEEIRITEFYLFLSKERFKDSISYDIVWESEDLKKCFVPKLCIEPVVENAVIHGLEPKGGRGNIRVNIKKMNEKLSINISDTGVGFDINSTDEDKSSGHNRVGIFNLKRLINNLYGSEYGINIESSIGKGSKVEIILPLLKEKTII